MPPAGLTFVERRSTFEGFFSYSNLGGGSFATRGTMPTRVNGIGTSYIGASNRQTFDGACEHCHRQAKLQNYETRLWFTVFFVPVIPLGRRQILSYCPCCTWHRALPLAQWQKITQEAIGESAAKWDENRDDP